MFCHVRTLVKQSIARRKEHILEYTEITKLRNLEVINNKETGKIEQRTLNNILLNF